MEQTNTVLTNFNEVSDNWIKKSGRSENPEDYLEALTAGAEALIEAAQDMGNSCLQAISKEESADLSHYFIPFCWAERFKDFMILWRDMLFEQQKARILLVNGQLREPTWLRLREESRETLTSAALELKAYPEKELQRIRRGRRGSAFQLEHWQKQENPWPTYSKQLDFLATQCRSLLKEHRALLKLTESFVAIRDLIAQTLKTSKEELEELERLAVDAIAFIGENIDQAKGPKPGRIAARLEDLETQLQDPHHSAAFSDLLEPLLLELPDRMQVSVGAEEGLLQFREINFRRSARQWLESKIIPVLYEVWELLENGRLGMQMSLVNIRNRAILFAAEVKENDSLGVGKADMCQPLQAFLTKKTDVQASLSELQSLIEKRLEEEFFLSAIYYLRKDFLPAPLQSTIKQLKLGQNILLGRIQRWWRQGRSRFQQFKFSVEQEESLGAPEKVVRFIRSRTADEENQHYTSIFLTKGYIGESFWVGRKNELDHMETLIDNWRRGFRGAVLLSGQRFTGKSLFGELVANRYFSKNTIRLTPKSILSVQSRRKTVGYHLGEALDFIGKYNLNASCLVWIDDLELWRDTDVQLISNMRKLGQSMNNQAGRIFFMVSMSNWLRAHLQKFFDMEDMFQTEINLDRTSAADIREAILIRHGATHKNLVDEKGREVNPQQFRKMTNRIAKASEGNIGEALNWWSFSTKRMDEERVIHQFQSSYALPDFLNPDSALLLSAIMLEKRTNEYRLRKLFGPAFSGKYGRIVQRLISIGLLSRYPDGWLEINEAAVNYVGRLLDRKGYLKFYK